MALKTTLFIWLLVWNIIASHTFAQEKSLIQLHYEKNYSPTYNEIISMYQLLDSAYANAVLLEAGPSDCGKPIHLFVINNENEFHPEIIRKKEKSIFLISNGIHPGEPEGIDANLAFADDLLRNKDGMAGMLDVCSQESSFPRLSNLML